MHLAGNMFALFIFVRTSSVCSAGGVFAIYYFACVDRRGADPVVGGAFRSIRSRTRRSGPPAGIFGLLLFYGMTFPHGGCC